MAVSRPLFASKFLSIEKIELCLFLVTIWLNFYTTDVFKNPVRIFSQNSVNVARWATLIRKLLFGCLTPQEFLKKDPVP